MNESKLSEHFRMVRDVFEKAVQFREPDERSRHLAAICAGNPALLDEVERLLRHHDRIASKLPPVTLPRFGPYQAVRQLGRGGMGVVYEAVRVDGEFERRVAVKVLAGATLDAALSEGLRAERQILAHLTHPNIAQLFDGSTTPAGDPYLVTEYVEGRHLDRYCTEENLDARRRLQLFSAVLAAVEYAHRNGVVHGDLKPSNVVVTAAGQPKLVDFGAARLLDGRGGQPQFATPEYASPELLAGEPADPATDVFALGVLYAKLLGGKAREAVVRKATAAARETRYATVAEFRSALLASRFAPRMAAALAAGLAVAGVLWWSPRERAAVPQRLTPPGTAWHRAAVSWSGEWIAYLTSQEAGVMDGIEVTRPGQTGVEKLSAGPGMKADPALSPDGMRVAYRSTREPAGIYEFDRATAQVRLLAAGGHQPQYSPDGKWLLYSIADNRRDPERGLTGQWRIMPAQGGSPSTVGGELSTVWWAGWAADSAALYFVGATGRKAAYSRLHRYDLATGILRQDLEWTPEHANHLMLPCGPVQAGRILAVSTGRRQALVQLREGPESTRIETLAQLPVTVTGCQSDARGRVHLLDAAVETRQYRLRLSGHVLEEAPIAAPGPLFLAGAGAGITRVFQQGMDEAVVESPEGTIAKYRGFPAAVSGDGQYLLLRRYLPAGPMVTKISVRTGEAASSFSLNAMAWGTSRDGRLGLLHVAPSNGIYLSDTVTSQLDLIYEDPRWRFYRATFSPDEKWVSFTVVENGGGNPQMRIAPFRGAERVPAAEWIEAGEGRAQMLSEDGASLYFAGPCGTFTCMLRLALHAQTKRPLGAPVPIAHFHGQWAPLNMDPTFFRMGLAGGALHFTLARKDDRVLLWDPER